MFNKNNKKLPRPRKGLGGVKDDGGVVKSAFNATDAEKQKTKDLQKMAPEGEAE